MAEAQIIGKVAVKVFPNTKRFRKELKDQLKKIKMPEVKLDVKTDAAQVKAEAKKASQQAQKAMEPAKLKINLENTADIEAGINKIKAKLVDLGRDHEIDLSLNKEGLERQLADLTEKRFIELSVDMGDTGSVQSAINQINAELAKLKEVKIPVGLNEEDLLKQLAELESKLPDPDPITIDISYNVDDVDSLKAALKRIDAELAKLDAVHIDVELNEESLLAARAQIEALIPDATFDVMLDPDSVDSVKRALSQVEAELAKRREIEFNISMDDAALQAFRDDLASTLESMTHTDPIEFSVTVDPDSAASIQAAIAKINAELSNLNSIEIPVGLDESELIALRAMLEKDLADIATIDLSINYDKLDSVDAAIKKINAELDQIRAVDISVKLNEADLTAELAKLNAAKAAMEADAQFKIDAKLYFDRAKNQALLDSIWAEMKDVKINAELDPRTVTKAVMELETALMQREDLKLKFEAELDPLAKRKLELELLSVQDTISDLKVKLNPEVDDAKASIVETILSALAKTRDVVYKPELNKAAFAEVGGLLKTLSGFNIIHLKFERFKELITNFDEAAISAAKVGTSVMGIGTSAIAAVGAVSSLAGSLVSIASAGLALPGIFGGMAVGLGLSAIALKDFNKQVPEAKTQWNLLKKEVSADFWSTARDQIRGAINVLGPEFRKQAEHTSKTLGQFFGQLASNLSDVLAPRLEGMFESLHESIHVFMGATDGIAQSIGVLGTVGASYLPRLAGFFKDLINSTAGWLTEMERTGFIYDLIDQGIVQLKGLGNTIAGLARIFYGVSTAAIAAGGPILSTFGASLQHVADIVNSEPFQTGLTAVFQAAFTAINNVATIAGPALQNMILTLADTFTAIAPKFGETVGLLTQGLATGLANPTLQKGIKNFFDSLYTIAETLKPVFDHLGEAIGLLAPVLGTMGEVIAGVLATSINGLVPSFEKLMPVLERVIQILGTGLNEAIGALEPVVTGITTAFADMMNNGGFEALQTIVTTVKDNFVLLAQIVGGVLKTAFDALGPVLPVVADLFKKVADFARPIVEDVAGVLKDVLPLVAEGFQKIVEKTIPVVDQLKKLYDTIAPVLIPVLKFLAEMLISTVVGAWNGLINIISGVISVVQGIIDFFVGLFTGNWKKMWDGFLSIVKGIWKIIIGAIEFALNWGVLGIFKKGATLLRGVWDGLWNGIKKFVETIWTGIKSLIDGAWNGIKSLFSSMGSAVKGVWEGIWNGIKSFLSGAWEGIKSAVSAGWEAVMTYFRNAPGNIVRNLGNLGNLLKTAGGDLLRGLWNGISGAASWLMGKVKNFFGKLLPGWAKDMLGINSPSTVFRDEIGVWLPAGLAEGMTGALAARTMKDAARNLAALTTRPMESLSMFDSGVSVMASFADGFDSGIDRVKDSLKGLGEELSQANIGAVEVPVISAAIAARAAQAVSAGGSGSSRTLNYYAAPGSSLSAEEDLFAAGDRARMFGW